MSIAERASLLIEEIFGNQGLAHPDSFIQENLPGQWENEQCDGYKVCCGKFRLCIIPKHENFVIKFGRSAYAENQCEREVGIYKDAMKSGIHKYFACPLAVLEYKNISFYVFEKIPNIGKTDQFITQNDRLYNISEGHFDGLEKYLKNTRTLSRFEKSSVTFLNDMHEGNFGYDPKRGHVVVTDYAF